MPDVVSKKLEDIEMVLAEQEKQIADLSDMVVRQWREIDALKISLKQAELRMGEMAQLASASAVAAARSALAGGAWDQDEANEAMSVADQARAMKPPHY